jgi:hypothetical protein
VVSFIILSLEIMHLPEGEFVRIDFDLFFDLFPDQNFQPGNGYIRASNNKGACFPFDNEAPEFLVISHFNRRHSCVWCGGVGGRCRWAGLVRRGEIRGRSRSRSRSPVVSTGVRLPMFFFKV